MLLFINHLATGPGLSSSVAETADPGSLLPLISCAMELGHFGKPPCVSNTLKFKTLWSTPCWGFLLHHCAEVASHMFELAVLAHTSFTPHKDGNSPVCELEMLAVSTSTLGRNGDSRVCQRMRRLLGCDTFATCHAQTEGTGIGSSYVVALMGEKQIIL